jgi:hypothetical protein
MSRRRIVAHTDNPSDPATTTPNPCRIRLSTLRDRLSLTDGDQIVDSTPDT